MEEEVLDDPFPLRSATENLILMHREVHFGGSFPLMIDYYRKGGKGVSSDFELQEIEALALSEKTSGQDLALVLLTGPEVEKVAIAKKAYQDLRELYERNKEGLPVLIADLILAESEEAEEEVAALAAEKARAVPLLVDLLRSVEFRDPLFPGYGQAPALAAKCLGKIGDRRAIASLFESIGEGDFFDESIALDSLRYIGEPAKEFLLKVAHGRPFNYDNERAAMALLAFKNDPAVASFCLSMLREPDVRKNFPLSTYFVLGCEGLSKREEREEFQEMGKDSIFPPSIRRDINSIAKEWKEGNSL